jgi:hypothetical protein
MINHNETKKEDVLDRLHDKYDRWIYDIKLTKIHVENPDTHELKETVYGELLEPGTLISMRGRPLFYSGYTWLDGEWVDEAGQKYSPYEFLLEILRVDRLGYHVSIIEYSR